MINATSTPTMVFSINSTRRGFLSNITAMVGAVASVVTSNRPIVAIFSINQVASMDEANLYHIVPSRLYVPLSSEDLAKAREELAKITRLMNVSSMKSEGS